ncbi:hypothetical protein [Blastopirellula marina]|uniref:Carboxypeptidase regulatory-like domain-containing protein n=1 Tax=Blastopirellula marina TaxID=124 RepID=A0A2S8GB47_9BACT|nr:hypothetical protein [Blastopirellula marina]PQO41657.1 hypothetical protein C5Y98_02735 [Blastopirellula marina]PTL46100.1 hypothetical protein C5Y97_02735 [Blastopirellula marina]
MKSKSDCHLAFFAMLVAAMSAIGCSSSPEMFEVSGNVTLDGKPITSGAVILAPADGSPDISRGDLVDGQYKLECLPGEKIVQIAGYTADQKVVPVQYVTFDSGLSASIQEDTPQLNFELTTKKRRGR